jgi:hypothetical protein
MRMRDQAMDGLYGRYHGRILELAERSPATSERKAELNGLLERFDSEARALSPACRRRLCEELAAQLEQEVLRFSDPDKKAILAIALKHFDGI